MVETHISYVLFDRGSVYKIKKAVRFPFLDFTTLDAREFYCREELRLNGRLAPAIGTADRGPYLQWLHFAEATAFRGATHSLLDSRLMIAWAKALNADGEG